MRRESHLMGFGVVRELLRVQPIFSPFKCPSSLSQVLALSPLFDEKKEKGSQIFWSNSVTFLLICKIVSSCLLFRFPWIYNWFDWIFVGEKWSACVRVEDNPRCFIELYFFLVESSNAFFNLIYLVFLEVVSVEMSNNFAFGNCL